MGSSVPFLLAALLAADPPQAAADDARPAPAGDAPSASAAEEATKSGAGVSPVELIPRLELRQSFARLASGASLHVTTAMIDIQFLQRVLLRYEGTLLVASGPGGQVSGHGDAKIEAIGMLAASPRFVAVAIAGAVLDTASQPQLGAGKQQLVFGAGAAFKPVRWLLPYVIVQEQLSVAGDAARPDVNLLAARVGNILFGPGYQWLKLDLDTVIDVAGDAGRLFGRVEAGRLLVGRIGLFMRGGTQLAGTRQVDYTLEVGIRYLFRLGNP
jgi:hypothetical protein